MPTEREYLQNQNQSIIYRDVKEEIFELFK